MSYSRRPKALCSAALGAMLGALLLSQLALGAPASAVPIEGRVSFAFREVLDGIASDTIVTGQFNCSAGACTIAMLNIIPCVGETPSSRSRGLGPIEVFATANRTLQINVVRKNQVAEVTANFESGADTFVLRFKLSLEHAPATSRMIKGLAGFEGTRVTRAPNGRETMNAIIQYLPAGLRTLEGCPITLDFLESFK